MKRVDRVNIIEWIYFTEISGRFLSFSEPFMPFFRTIFLCTTFLQQITLSVLHYLSLQLTKGFLRGKAPDCLRDSLMGERIMSLGLIY
jgi:hypothetical protein